MAAPTFVADEVVTATKMNSLPKGLLGYAEVTANQSGISVGSVVDLTGLSVAVTVVASRRIRIVGYLSTTVCTVASDRSRLVIRESTTVLSDQFKRFTGTTSENGLTVMRVLTPSAGAHTYKLSYEGFGSGSHTAGSNATAPGFIVVEDLGSV